MVKQKEFSKEILETMDSSFCGNSRIGQMTIM